MRNSRGWLLVVCLLATVWLTACGDDKHFFITKHWGEWQIKLETRPFPIRKGHNEFLLHVDGSHRRLPRGMMIYYRLSPEDEWIQAMPDGLSDIFRRALTVRGDPADAKLYVHIKYHEKKTDLVFDLSKQPRS
ncbi:MAG TPA: hypothetical protein VJ961_04435 [Mariprofundaceae bacterium]|nr:hypothetical protein [Mariprofundaceae bacterium]